MSQREEDKSQSGGDPLTEAEAYLRDHKIMELFEDLNTILCYTQPENVEEFLIEALKQRKQQGTRSQIYTEKELSNIYSLFDLRNQGFITQQQCQEALKSLANSEFHYQKASDTKIPEKVDKPTFLKLCKEILGV